MPNQNEFIFASPSLVRNRSAVSIPVEYVGKLFKCIVSGELLKDCFDSSHTNLLDLYEDNKGAGVGPC